MVASSVLGAKVRALRRREGLTQKKMAERLGISASYLNLIEHDKRPLSASLLISLARQFDVDLASFAADNDAVLAHDLMEVFGDRMFEEHGLTNAAVQDLARQNPELGRAVLTLYSEYRRSREQAESLALRVVDDQDVMRTGLMPSEEVTDFIQRRRNYFGELEEAADALRREAQKLAKGDVERGLVMLLESRGITLQRSRSRGSGFLRSYDPGRRILRLSESLSHSLYRFQLAHQLALLECSEGLDRIADGADFRSEGSHALARMVLANYVAAAILMPYDAFLEACRAERYDIDLLANHFGATFESICHRMSSLQRPGSEGVPFHFLKIDNAGNISKRFSASGIRFARFGGSCPKWNVSVALLQPDRLRIQLSEMPDGRRYFCVARRVEKRTGGFRGERAIHGVGLGCLVEHASQLIYADGMDLEAMEPELIGVSCRLCERTSCQQRAFPSVKRGLELDENQRWLGFYSSAGE